MGQSVGADVEIVVVLRFIDAHAPEDDRWVIPVATNHASNVVDGNVLPCLVADMLPSGDLFKHKKAKLIACIEEMSRLRVVRRSYNIALETVAQNLRIATLHPSRHRLTDKRKRLVAVESAQLDDLAVKREAARREVRFTKTNAAAVFIAGSASVHQLHVDTVELRMLEIPQLNRAE